MYKVFRWGVRLILAAIVGVIAVASLAWFFASRSLPDYDATYKVTGLSAPVDIVRTTEDVPHIFGQDDPDVFFALGLAHAQDRLWQMTLMRRTVQGRLSEIFGARTLKTDELMRRLGLYQSAVDSLPAQSDYTKRALAAYARGVNQWIEIVNKGAMGRGAPEFFLFDNKISYWTPADSLAILKLMAVQLTDQMKDEVLRARVSMLGHGYVNDLLPDDPSQGTAALPSYASLFPTMPKGIQMAEGNTGEGMLSPFPKRGLAGASNAWAAAPDRSAAGGSLLANDPHLGLTAPTIWYLARLQLKGGGVIGGTIPGMPLILSGRNKDLGWGLTTAYVDDQDLHVEKLDPDDPTKYLTPDGYKPFRTKRVIINVKDSKAVTITLRWTENGPVIPGSHFDIATVTPPGDVMSLSWTALDPHDTSMTGAMDLMRSHSIDDALTAAAKVVAPAQNITLADKTGVALVTAGAIPLRDPANETQGRMPNAGWKPINQWHGTLPFKDNPQFIDPKGGIVVNTNNKTVDRPFPYNVSFNWGDTQRIQRLTKLMGEREVHSRDSFISAQLDTVSPAARGLLPLVGANLWFTGDPAPDGTPERQRQRALELLASWDGEMSEHLPEPLIYAAWMRELQDRLIRDELGPLAKKFTHIEPVFLERVFRNTDGASRWCDVVQSAPKESCTDIARQSLDAALLDLTKKYGPNVASWRWGDAHIAEQDHPVLGKVPGLKWFVNIRQSSSGGDFTLMRGETRGGDGPDSFANVHAAGYREVLDFADPDSSVFITSTGQSGHPLSRHYDDLSELWRAGEYIPMSLDPALAKAGNIGITHLRPTAAANGN